jgi:hypothetical protein
VVDPWLSIMLTLCHILHSVSHWPVSEYLLNSRGAAQPSMAVLYCSTNSLIRASAVLLCCCQQGVLSHLLGDPQL